MLVRKFSLEVTKFLDVATLRKCIAPKSGAEAPQEIANARARLARRERGHQHCRANKHRREADAHKGGPQNPRAKAAMLKTILHAFVSDFCVPTLSAAVRLKMQSR